MGAARAEPSERGNTLLLCVAAPAGETERLEGVARELLSRLDVQIELRRVSRIDLAELRRRLAPGERYFARVFIALPPSGRARLYLEHGASDRVLVREVAGDPKNPELLREELGHILQTAVEGLKAGEEVGTPRDEALKDVPAEDAELAREAAVSKPSVQAEPVAPERAASAPSHPLRFGPRYEVQWVGDGARFEDGPGVVLALSLPVGVELNAYYRRPLEVEGAPAGVRLHTLSARALVTLEVWRGARSGLRLAAGAGADFVRVSALGDPGANVELSATTFRRLAVARLQAGYAWRAFSFMELELTAGADLDANDTRYVFEHGSSDSTLLDPSPVRPFLALGATLP